MPAISAQLPGFRHAMVETGTGIRYHTVIGGSGAPVFLLHGFPQTWWEWRHIMPPLARSRTVVAVDLKGGGHSDKPATGYEKSAMGRDLEEVRQALGLGPVAIVGHDIGGMVAYAWAAAHPRSVDRLAVIDVALPGTTALDRAVGDPLMWHFAFHQRRDLPELLIRGHEFAYVETIIRERIHDQASITEEDLHIYAAALARPGGTRGMLEWYRALPQDAADNRSSAAAPLEMPVLAVGGDRRWGPRMVSILRELATNVRGGAIEDCGHWVPEEKPEALLARLEPFLAGK
jgi:pimeloyl-ACP methyl ester carboxylesterase